MKKSQDKSSTVVQILPEPTPPTGLSSASMQQVMKAALENQRPLPTLRAQNRQPTKNSSNPSPAMLEMKAHAEHLAGTSFSMDELQPHRPSLAAQRNARSTKS
ncbi:hypothetical protein [Marivivens marinus]|uniref:hypothetical protein n=1 Tax=Marivivens marinus TaxID=3110173 RepID=UPI003B84649F